jgi:uncharacterized membrane protein HdeD (DUF308 family)
MILEYAKKCEKSMLISTVITLILGIVLIIEPTGSIKMLTSIIAIMCMLMGGFQVIDYLRKPREEKMMSLSLILGVILLSIGLFLFINADALIKFITVIIGCTLCLKSLFKLQFAFNLNGISGKWKYNLIAGLVGMSLGLLLIINPFESAELFLRIMGIVIVIGSIAELIETAMVMKTLEDVKEINFIDKPKKDKKKEEDIPNPEEMKK